MAPEKIDYTEITGYDGETAYRVSTVKLREEDYETMVFPGADEWGEVDVARTDSRRLAKGAHAALVKTWTAKANSR